MTTPKRHHWWPQLQSRHWCNGEGFINVVDKSGNVAQRTPINLGVKTHLYSTFNDLGEKDPAIEKWFANAIDGPFDDAFDRIFDFDNVRREPAPDWPEKRKSVQELGYLVGKYINYLIVNDDDRAALCRYVAGLLIRNPAYLKKVALHYEEQLPDKDKKEITNLSLSNMLFLYERYMEVLDFATIGVIRTAGTNEFIFPDVGIVAQEPWASDRIPFDIHVPLTPEICVEVLPIRGEYRQADFFVSNASNNAISRHNRISLGYAQHYVFTRERPPVEFIKKYLGVPAPKNIGYRFINGRLDTKFDPRRT